MHDGDWVELARLDDLLRAAQDLFEAHPPATLYEDGGLIPPAGSEIGRASCRERV